MAIIVGDDNANSLFGTGAADTIRGSGGDDQIFAAAGDDIVIGGAGAVIANLTSGLGALNVAQGDLYLTFENVTGSDFGDVLSGKNRL